MTKPIVLSDGSYLLLVFLSGRQKIAVQFNKHYLAGKNSRFFKELDEERKVFAFISKDQGETWEKRGGFVPDESVRDWEEPAVIQRKDGSLLAYMRTRQGIYQSESFDVGATWSEPVPVGGLNSSVSRFFLTKLQSGNLLLVYNPRPQGAGESQDELIARRSLAVCLSHDEGKTWTKDFIIEDRVSSYPDGFQTPDGRIFITYDQERRSGQICMAVFTEKDVIACQPETPVCIFKYPIHRSATLIANEIGYGPQTGYIKFF